MLPLAPDLTAPKFEGSHFFGAAAERPILLIETMLKAVAITECCRQLFGVAQRFDQKRASTGSGVLGTSPRPRRRRVGIPSRHKCNAVSLESSGG